MFPLPTLPVLPVLPAVPVLPALFHVIPLFPLFPLLPLPSLPLALRSGLESFSIPTLCAAMERKTSVLGLDFHFSYLWLYQKNGIVGTDLVQDGRIGPESQPKAPKSRNAPRQRSFECSTRLINSSPNTGSPMRLRQVRKTGPQQSGLDASRRTTLSYRGLKVEHKGAPTR